MATTTAFSCTSLRGSLKNFIPSTEASTPWRSSFLPHPSILHSTSFLPEALPATRLQARSPTSRPLHRAPVVAGILDIVFGGSKSVATPASERAPPANASRKAAAPDADKPTAGCEFVQLAAGCFWGVELAFQRVPGVTRTEVGYTQGWTDAPRYEDICYSDTNHVEAVRVEFDPKVVSLEELMEVFWSRHNPTTLNRQGNDVGFQYRSGVYFYGPEQEAVVRASLERQQLKLGDRTIATEVLPARTFYRAEEYHQQYLSKGGRFSSPQSAAKGCSDPIRCYG